MSANRRDVEIAWAAGVFEGEGSWYMRSNGYTLQASLGMTDRDVVERFREVVGFGSISRKDFPDKKTAWIWRVSGENVSIMAEAFWPHLGCRRRARFTELAEQRQLYVQARVAPRACETCSEVFAPALSKSSSRVLYCSDRCRQRAWYIARAARREYQVLRLASAA